MHQLKYIYNSPFKDSHSRPIHTCFPRIANNADRQQWYNRLWFRVLPILANRYIHGRECVIAGVTPEVNPREHVTHMPPSSANKVTHSGFETGGGNVTKIPKQGYPWSHKKDLCPLKIKKKGFWEHFCCHNYIFIQKKIK